jgi:hypothetical protein
MGVIIVPLRLNVLILSEHVITPLMELILTKQLTLTTGVVFFCFFFFE